MFIALRKAYKEGELSPQGGLFVCPARGLALENIFGGCNFIEALHFLMSVSKSWKTELLLDLGGGSLSLLEKMVGNVADFLSLKVL